MVNAGFDRNGLKLLDQLHKALHGHFKHAPAKLRRGRGCVAAYTVAAPRQELINRSYVL